MRTFNTAMGDATLNDAVQAIRKRLKEAGLECENVELSVQIRYDRFRMAEQNYFTDGVRVRLWVELDKNDTATKHIASTPIPAEWVDAIADKALTNVQPKTAGPQ